MSKEVADDLRSKNIVHEASAPCTPEQNESAEISNQVIYDRTLSVMLKFRIPKPFWLRTMQACSYVLNRCNKADGSPSPHELLTGVEPDNTHIRNVGCIAMVHIDKKLRKKWDHKTDLGMMIGYEMSSGNYLIWMPRDIDHPSPTDGKIVVRSDVSFLEQSPFWRIFGPDSAPGTKITEKLHPADKPLATLLTDCMNSSGTFDG